MKFPSIFARKETKPTGQPEASLMARGRSGGTYVDADVAMQVSAYHRGTVYLSSQLAKLPFLLKDKLNNNIDDDLAELLTVAPNREMNSFFFFLLMIQRALHTGNAYAEIERDLSGRPLALWPIELGGCEPVRDPSGKLWYRISSTTSNTGRDTLLDVRDIYCIRNLHTKDGIVGQGIVAYAMETLGIAKGADKFANSIFANSGMPSGVLTVPGSLSDEAFERLKESWKDAHGGRKTGGTALLEEGAEYNSITMAPEVLQFLESRKFSVLEIARFFGIPPQKLFDSESATYNNIEHANLEVTTDTLDAWTRNIEAETLVKLVHKNRGTEATKCEMDLRAVYRGDMDTRSSYYTRRMQTASISPNEIREMEGDTSYEGGDNFYIAANNYSPVDRLDDIIDAQISSKDNTDEAKKKDAEAELTKAATAYLSKRK